MQTNDRVGLRGTVGGWAALLALGVAGLGCAEAPGTGSTTSPVELGVRRGALSEREPLRNVALDLDVETGAQSTQPDYSARHATDGDTDTAVGPTHSWTNSSDPAGTGLLPQWLDVSLAGKRRVRGALLYTSSGHELGDYELQVWADAGWQTVAGRSNNTDTIVEHAFAAIVTDKVRLLARRGPDAESGQARVNELQLDGADIEDADVLASGEGANESEPIYCTGPACPSPAPTTCAECLKAPPCPSCLYWAGDVHELELPVSLELSHLDVYYRANGVFRRRTLTDLTPVDGSLRQDGASPEDEHLTEEMQLFHLTERLSGIAGSSVTEVRAFMTTSPPDFDRLTFQRDPSSGRP